MRAISATDPLRIGVLGAAAIAPMALVRPARDVPDACVHAVAARDVGRARSFAEKHAIPVVHASYDELIADPDLDAIYNPLPNGLHCEWTIRALEAGKHVLCEKPIASNEAEALRMQEVADKTGLVLLEAFHYRYHPLAARVRELIDTGEIGRLRHVEASLCIPMLKPGDIRFRWDLAGGALMDTGSYTVNMVRFLASSEPEVLSARAKLSSPNVDRAMDASLRFPDGVTGRIQCSLLSSALLKIGLRAVGDLGELRVFNPVAPQIYHHLTLKNASGSRRERLTGDATYVCQLRAFVGRVAGGPPLPTEAADGVLNMRAIDAIYDAAGLPRRGT